MNRRMVKESIMVRLLLLCQVVMGLALTADACSGFYVGKKVSKDGSILLGRTIDVGPAAGSRVVVAHRHQCRGRENG